MIDPPVNPPRLFVRRASDSRCLSPYRVTDEQGAEIGPVNEFLDATAVRGLAQCTLRTYAFALRHAWQWIIATGFEFERLTENDLVAFIRVLREPIGNLSRAPRSINLCLRVFRSCVRFHTGRDLPHRRAVSEEAAIPFAGYHSDFMGGRRSRPRSRPKLRVKVPRRLVVPLGRDEVVAFFQSLRTRRDLAIVSLMLFCGLRSREILQLRLDDVDFFHDQFRVLGKGDKDRVLPLAPDARSAIESYLRQERPAGSRNSLFVVLKGKRRGNPMTASGLRRIFRYHRARSKVAKANPHRFRHTFAADMVNAGMSLPALMRLMGHTHFETTLRYVNLSADDVRDEFLRAVRRRDSGADS